MEYIELGSAPYEEDCVQVSNTENYLPRMKAECSRYMVGLQAAFPEGKFDIRRFFHDFGLYYEVIVKYDPSKENEVIQAFSIEESLPATWKDLESLAKAK